MKTYITDLIILVVALAVFGSVAYVATQNAAKPAPGAPAPIASVIYRCDGGKTIAVDYYQGETTPPAKPGMPPTPGGSVALALSDGRNMTLPQTISADGMRYANADESFIFWGKGNGAFVMEGNTMTYQNCVQQ
jgi:membrane-bound inhibitor of C-type lysozyme